MKKYIKSENYINLDDELDTLIEEFDPFIEDAEPDVDYDKKGYGWISFLINDKNSDFSEWLDAKIDIDGDLVYWEWNRETFFDRSYTDDMNIKKLLGDASVVAKVQDVLDYYVETGVVGE